ncbi:MAG: hypothetical protein ACLR6I_00765 [Waltera sp.]
MRDPYLYEVEARGNFRVDDALDTAVVAAEAGDLADLRVIEKEGIFLKRCRSCHCTPWNIICRGRAGTRIRESGGWRLGSGDGYTGFRAVIACMGANALCWCGEEPDSPHRCAFFHQICLERGFLTGNRWITEEKIPVYRGYPRSSGCPGENRAGRKPRPPSHRRELLAPDGRTLTERPHYRYQAKWGHTARALSGALDPVHRQPDGMLVPLTVLQQSEKGSALHRGSALFIPVRRTGIYLSRISRWRSCPCGWLWKPGT